MVSRVAHDLELLVANVGVDPGKHIPREVRTIVDFAACAERCRWVVLRVCGELRVGARAAEAAAAEGVRGVTE